MNEDLPANTGDTGLIPGQGGFKILQSSQSPLHHNDCACMLQLLEPMCLEAVLNQKPGHCNEEMPLLTATRKVHVQQPRPSKTKNK